MASERRVAINDLSELLAPVAPELHLVEKRIARATDTDQLALTEAYAALFAGGKRVRPAVALLAAGPEWSGQVGVVSLGAALEMLHSATLIHDDIIDRAPIRRGGPTLSAIHGSDTAILAGDHLFALAAVVVTDTENLRALRIFANTLVTISSGELEQIWRRTELPSKEDYLRLIYAKTACLFESAALGGALLAGRPEEEVQRFGTYGRCLGLAFQIADDVLDYVGDSARMGKPTGNDLKRGLLTLPALLYLWQLPRWRRLKMPKEVSEADVDRLLAAIVSGGFVDQALEMARGFAEQAWEAIEPLTGGEYGDALRSLTYFALERAS